ncbi:MAG: class I SAM-dependent rRNA methyltransferase [Brevinematia bacterium]
MEEIGEVIIKEKAEKKVRNFYLWIYKDEIVKKSISKNEGIVNVLNQKKEFICRGFYSSKSFNPIKVLTYDKSIDIETEIKKRILFSLENRLKLVNREILPKENFRVVYSESDFLPGLIIDKYNEFVGIQIRNRLFDNLRDIVIDGIMKFLNTKNIYERSYGEIREKEENLEPRNVALSGTIPKTIRIEENGIQFVFDPFKGQKTGFFLDQSINRKIVSQMCRNNMKVLDVFSYVGGFAMYCAKKGAEVIAIEKNETYAELIKENAASNGVKSKVNVIVGDAFEKIKELDDKFDLIILDPPTLVKNLSESRRRLPLLIDLIKKSLGILSNEGKLVIFTCSYNLLKEHFIASIRIAAMELGVRVKVEDELLQSLDHPWVLQMPETLYLKGFILSKLPKF